MIEVFLKILVIHKDIMQNLSEMFCREQQCRHCKYTIVEKGRRWFLSILLLVWTYRTKRDEDNDVQVEVDKVMVDIEV